MSRPLAELEAAALRAGRIAVLLDFDGTLVPIAERPDAVVLAPETARALADLAAALDGAVAIVSGRTIDELDRLFAPAIFAVAGTHGLERRGSDGVRHHGDYDRAAVQQVEAALREIFAAEEGLLFERKPGSVALHYRQRPELEEACRAAVARLVEAHDGAHMLTGKMVVEAKLGRRSKADAVFDFMAEAPFHGRMPVYAGDDVTDEDAFRAVAELGGVSIKIGDGDSIADYRVADTQGFLDWLAAAAAGLGRQKRENGAK